MTSKIITSFVCLILTLSVNAQFISKGQIEFEVKTNIKKTQKGAYAFFLEHRPATQKN